MTTGTEPTLTPGPKLRAIEPFRMNGQLVAEVFISKIGAGAIVTLELDAESGEMASLTFSPREANDLMLWLKCALEET